MQTLVRGSSPKYNGLMYDYLFKGAPFGNDNAAKNRRGGSGGNSATINAMLENLHTQGGFTYHPATDSSPKEGMAVSPYPEHTKLIPLKDIKGSDLVDYALEKAALFEDPLNHIGAWVSEGKVFLDVSVVAKTHEQAKQVCEKHDQIAYFDLKEGKEYTVNKNATSGGVVNKTENGMTDVVEKAAEKPELHLMPGKGITVDMVGKMFKSITGKDMDPEDRATCEAKLAVHTKKMGLVKKSNLHI